MPKIIQMALEYLQIQRKACTSLCFSASPPRIGIFRFDCIKACLRHDLSRHVESARRNMKIEASDQIPHPLWVVIKCPAPGKTKFIKFSPSRAAKNVKCPGYARGGGGMFNRQFDGYTTIFIATVVWPKVSTWRRSAFVRKLLKTIGTLINKLSKFSKALADSWLWAFNFFLTDLHKDRDWLVERPIYSLSDR